MLQIIKKLLLKIVDNIDSGNSNLSESETIQVIEALKGFTDREVRLSKYLVCQYLNVSRATFDNFVRAKKIPEGLKISGFKEKFWLKRDIDKFIKEYRTNKKK